MIHKILRKNTFILLYAFTAFVACELPYRPEPEPGLESMAVSSNSGVLYPINNGPQICNPSISPNPHYSGCMLWLNYDGLINVRVPDSLPGYNTGPAGVRMHDRLTVTDTSNTVRWYAMNTDLGLDPDKQLQDPEWSTHPDYITYLSQKTFSKWAAGVVRVSDHGYINLTEGILEEISTPHVWIDPAGSNPKPVDSPAYDENGFIDRKSVEAFFGTSKVKLVYSKLVNGSYTLFFIDYSDSKPRPVMLPKPSGAGDFALESPMISPDGNWIVYNAAYRINGSNYASYAQQLRAGSTPYPVSENAAAPHWWVHPNRDLTYVVYAQIEGNYGVGAKYTPDLERTGAAGSTYKQQVMISGSDNLAHHASFALIGEAQRLVALPFKGGLSPDSRFLCTGYDNGYIMYLN